MRAADAPRALVLLKSGDYAALDHQLNALQAEYETGRATEDQLYTGFRQLYEDSPANERYFSAWVQAYPSQVNTMTEYLSDARPDLLASMELTAKPYLSSRTGSRNRGGRRPSPHTRKNSPSTSVRLNEWAHPSMKSTRKPHPP